MTSKGLLRINERGIASYQIGGLTFKTQRKFLHKNHQLITSDTALKTGLIWKE